MRRSAVVAGVAAATLLLPTAAHAETRTFDDPVGDANRVEDGKTTEDVTGDSDITGLQVRAIQTEGDELGLRLRVQVREIDRASRWREKAKTGLRFSAKLKTDNGARITFEGTTRSFGWSTTGVDDCFGDGERFLPDLDYRRYSDVVVLDMPGECFAGAETVTVSAGTKLVDDEGRLVDRVAGTEPVRFGAGPGES